MASALREALGVGGGGVPGASVVDVSSMARAMHSTDASNYRHVPIAVVSPRSVEEVVTVLKVAHELGLPVLPRGAATSIAGQATNEAVLIDFTRHLSAVEHVDFSGRKARVQPGVVLDRLRAAAEAHDLTFGPDPSSHSRCTLGGMIGNNACGSHSVAWGKTADNVRSLDVALVDGTRFTARSLSRTELDSVCREPTSAGALHRALRSIVDEYGDDIRAGMPRLRRRVSGYNLDALLPENGFDVARALVGSEGTCVTVLGATVDLVASPQHRVLCVLGFPGSVAAADAVPALLDLPVLTMEGIDVTLAETFRALDPDRGLPPLPEGTAWLYVETGGDSAAEALEGAHSMAARSGQVGASALVVSEAALQRHLWRVREEGAGLATRLPDGSEAWSGWEDAAVPPERLGGYLREFDSLMRRHDRKGVAYGHFGEGCVHVRIDFPFTARDGLQRYRAFLEEAADLVVAHGGSLSGEHGDGQARSELLARMYPPRVMRAFTAYKAAFDPGNLMNPHRFVDPAALDADVRPAMVLTLPTGTRLALLADSGDLGAASRRCVGVGKCITDSGGVMCPSYRATRQEQHSTRGRSRLLFEMLAGEVVTDRWRSPEVRDALDLCLGCKGCKTDCPVGVDMATYKVEFLSRHYEGRRRPASHYAMGALPRWLGLASHAPRLVNAVGRSPLAGPMKRLGGVASERAIPPLSRMTMRRRLRALVSAGPDSGGAGSSAPGLPLPTGRRQVLLLPDTFTDHFDAQVGVDAAAVLEHVGESVALPEQEVCCGLTWYSTGQLRTARKVLRRTLDVLEPWVDAGVPIVGLEPSCTAMLRHDAAQLLPDDERVPRLAAALQTFAERLTLESGTLPGGGSSGPVSARHYPHRVGPVLSQVHCHQYADLGFAADLRLLHQISEDVQVVDGGCCGLAGNFGFERGHYEVSVACAEQKLLPAIRGASPDRVIHADGFSCRTQVRQLTNREPAHLATLTARALGLTSA